MNRNYVSAENFCRQNGTFIRAESRHNSTRSTLTSTLDRYQGATRQQTSSYTQYRAPSEHGQTLISPALSESAGLISENRAKQADQKTIKRSA